MIRPKREPRPRRHRYRSAAALGATAAVVAVTLSACTGSSSGGGQNSADGQRLVIGLSAEIMNLDPGLAPTGGRETIAIRDSIFDTLVTQGDELRPKPRLAESWSNPDARTWVFKLRKGVKFTNGEPFNAEVAKYNIERVLDSKLQLSYYSQLSAIVSDVKAVDDMTLQLTTKSAAPGLLTILDYMQIVPEQYMKKVGDKQFNTAPIGSGPFKFDKREGDQVYLTRNDDYWGGKPKLKTVVFQTIPEVSARVAALQSGAINIANEIPPDVAKTLTGDTKTETVSGTRIFFLGMNVKAKPFDDPAVRRAVVQAVDTQSIAKNLYVGEAQPLNQDAFKAMLGYQPNIPGNTFDQAAASAVLKNVTTPVVIDVTQADATLGQAVLGQLQAAGLKAQIQTVEDSAFDTKTEAGQEQAYLSSWGVAEGDLDALIIRHFWSGRDDTSKYTNYSNPSLDDQIKQEQSTVDPAARQKIFAGIMQTLLADAPWVPIVTPNEIYGVSSNVTGWTPSPIGLFHLLNTQVGRS
ncbi:ABC transporter substrate-binding protein [Jatrophihabitans cynanchi]|uniref:ABC transporter substrate-binding protein n=1 Tax=Jatrophihabitans cynanchi TaxID=2944128 RepID=A0ABY7JS52_9ACTN|nr:ABC transporter substrate-binding protein [Jatrophihabitans sp. SB3-54]WAX55159.1 ABC transporter substrate-binding protein [Jatrophihabitans sp. SB3-54]